MRPVAWLSARLDEQRGHLFPWLAVVYGIGVGIYFALRVEPGRLALSLIGLCVVGLFVWARRERGRLGPLLLALGVCLCGVLVASARSHWVAAPVMQYRYYGPVEGRIVAVDRSANGAQRLTLDRVILRDTAPDRTPDRVRVALYGPEGFAPLTPGLRVALTAHLGPPPGPSEPGGFDFRRMVWFDRLGAVGYSPSPVLRASSRADGAWIAGIRRSLAQAVMARMPSDRGAFAAALLTGDRSAISQDRLEDLRLSNLAHLLAISGLHMGLLTGLVFGAVRGGLALIPRVALNLPIARIAAAAAFGAGAVYLALSGGSVATQRAYIMVGVMLGAVMLGRRAISLRAVAVAAIIVLTLRPEALVEAGFQMSFAATTALVAGFGLLTHTGWRPTSRIVRIGLPLLASSFIAGLATAPFAAAHFNRIADYGLLANLLAVPLMGAVVMPAGLAALGLSLVGLEGLAIAVLDPALGWILGVARWIADQEGAVTGVPMPPTGVLAAIALSGLWVILWQGRARVFGLGGLILTCSIWAIAPRPPVLIAGDGSLVGVMSAEGRVLSRPSGAGFIALSWLENDGDFVPQAQASARGGITATKTIQVLPAPPDQNLFVTIVHLRGKTGAQALGDFCRDRTLLVIDSNTDLLGPCQIIDAAQLDEAGAIAIGFDRADVTITTANAVAGRRPWTTPRGQ